ALGNQEVRVENVYTVTTGADEGIRSDPGTGPVTATLASGAYTGAQLPAQIKTALEAVSGGKTYTVNFNETTEKYNITNDLVNAAPLSLLFSDPLSTATPLAGFNASAKTGLP